MNVYTVAVGVVLPHTQQIHAIRDNRTASSGWLLLKSDFSQEMLAVMGCFITMQFTHWVEVCFNFVVFSIQSLYCIVAIYK